MSARAAPLGFALALSAGAAAAEAPFAVQELWLGRRVVQADLVDLDGDRRADLLCTGSEGLPPDEHRSLHVFYQRDDGAFAPRPDWSGALPGGAAAYDLADLDEKPGAELVLLRRDRLTLLSWPARLHARRDLPTGPEPTLALVADERGLDRLALARDGLADEPRLVVPGLGWTALLAPSGALLGRLDVGARANFFLPPRPAPVFSESEAELYFDHPRLLVGDVDGDGRGDVTSATRHELRVFLQDADGRFPARPSRRFALGQISPEDHVRNAGSVRVDGADLDADGRLDLLVSAASGSLFESSTRLSVYRNRDGRWHLDEPDQQLAARPGLRAGLLLDLDGDGRVELIDVRIPTHVLELVELLVTREIDAEISVYRRAEGASFAAEPWQRWTLGVGWSLSTFRTLGFVPTATADVDGDGLNDLLGSGSGDRLEVRLGDADTGFGKLDATQPLDTAGRIRFGDLDADGLPDFVLYDPRRPDAALRVGRNRGVLGRH